MKKKLLGFLCVIACALSLTACGTTTYTEMEQNKMSTAITYAQDLLTIAQYYGTEEDLETFTTNYGKHENEEILKEIFYQLESRSLDSEYGVFEGMLTTYVQASEDMGGIVNVGEATAKISGDEIVVTIPLMGNDADGTFECTFANDIFYTVSSVETTANLSFAQNMHKAGQSMGKAGLNTLLGMGTVFCILILICLIISCFSLFKPKAKPVEVKKEEAPAPAVEEELTDDTELVAVIMAAINAYESANGGSTDGFVVRSIRRANRRN